MESHRQGITELGGENKKRGGGMMWAEEARFNVSINYSGRIPKLFSVFVMVSAIF